MDVGFGPLGQGKAPGAPVRFSLFRPELFVEKGG